MYRFKKFTETVIKRNNQYEGESIEKKIRRITSNKEPIKDGAPIIYTERKEGVRPEYDIRTDRFEVALEAMDKVSKTIRSKREERQKIGEKAVEGMKKEGEITPGGSKEGEA